MDEKDKVQILLKEYDTLRAEILQRIGHRFGCLGLMGAVGVYAFFMPKDLGVYQIIVLTISILVLLVVRWQLGNLIARCANRNAEIEEIVNKIAGETLLRWEHERLGSKFFHKMHR